MKMFMFTFFIVSVTAGISIFYETTLDKCEQAVITLSHQSIRTEAILSEVLKIQKDIIDIIGE